MGMKGIKYCGECNFYDWEKCLLRENERILGKPFFDNCPLPDVEEVKRGVWKSVNENDNVWECSGKDGCGEQYMLIVGTPEDNKFMYCPNCGAKMIEKEIKGK